MVSRFLKGAPFTWMFRGLGTQNETVNSNGIVCDQKISKSFVSTQDMAGHMGVNGVY
jgi:hypothetical protein